MVINNNNNNVNIVNSSPGEADTPALNNTEAAKDNENIIDEILRTNDPSVRIGQEVERSSGATRCLENFCKENRIDRKTDIFDWWHRHPDANFKKVALVAIICSPCYTGQC